jgi:hypothetical protein
MEELLRVETRTFKGWHGTSLNNVESIRRDGFRKALGLLGIGAFFDLENPDSGWQRAALRYPDEAHALIGVRIVVNTLSTWMSQQCGRRSARFNRR